MANPQKEDGYTPIANELLEALFRWRGSAAAVRFTMAVMRETYGWSEKMRQIPLRRLSFLIDVSDVRVRQMRDAAVAANMVVRDGDRFSVQKDFDAWVIPAGDGVSDEVKAVLRRGVCAEGTAHCAEGTAQNGVTEGTADSGAEGTAPHHIKQDVKQESKDSAPNVGAAVAENLFGNPPAKKKPRPETATQVYIRDLWVATGHEGNPNNTAYPKLVKLVNKTPKELLVELHAHVHRHTIRVESMTEDGASEAFSTWFTGAIGRPWEWRDKSDKQKKPPLPKGDFIRLDDGSILPRSEWSLGDSLTIDRLKTEGNWNSATGRPRTPAKGFRHSDADPHPEETQ